MIIWEQTQKVIENPKKNAQASLTDNSIHDRLADTWWEVDGVLAKL